MKIIKNINNNYAIALDGDGNQLIVSGKGIGFGTVPREITDTSVINRSYYDVEDTYVSMIKDLPEDVIAISTMIVDHARSEIDTVISSNLVFALADHISFSIKRFQKGMSFKLPIAYDVEHLYEKEYDIGLYGLELIRKKLKTYVPKEEAAYIALHIIDAEERGKNNNQFEVNDEVIEDVIKIIEKDQHLMINRDSVNFSRFTTHMQYLLKRCNTKHLIQSENRRLYELMKDEFPVSWKCAIDISEYLEKRIHLKLTDEEQLYLILHINRLCSHEDCNQ
jgi:beta-glucoside operon transcriptional antiterminator